MSIPAVSAIIVTYKRPHRLAEAIRAVSACGDASEIVVVVDGCHDGSYELASEMARSDARIRVAWRANGGDAAARQTGIETATGEIVLMLDDDVIASPGLAGRHALRHVDTPGAVVVGYMPVRLPTKREAGQFATRLYADEYERACRRYEADPGSILRGLWAGNVSLRRTDALRIGIDGGSKLYYHSDQEFGLRCLRAGLVGVFDRDLKAEHLHERDTDAFLWQARQRGWDRRTLEILFPDLVQVGDFDDEMSRLTCGAIAVAAASPLRNTVTTTLRCQVRRAGRAHAWRLESAIARFMRQIELRRGYQDGPPLRVVDETQAARTPTHALT
jgi:glycosyltransferase involved in cell wall biosynthesis